jgi:hypothetical protein
MSRQPGFLGARTPRSRLFFEAAEPSAKAQRRLLLISMHFPPAQAIGALRWQKLARYAHERGWGLDVLTLDPECLERMDSSTLDDLPPGTRVFGVRLESSASERAVDILWQGLRRLRSAPVRRRGSIGRTEVHAGGGMRAQLRRAYFAWREQARDLRWARHAAHAGVEMVRPAVHRAVVSCGPPHLAHEAGRRVAARTGLPLIVDLRDPWSLVERLPEEVASPLWFARARWFERRVVAAAALVVTNTDACRRAMAALYPGAAPRIITVMNGYDDDERIPLAATRPGGRFVIAYAGSIYIDRDPTPLFRAAALLISSLRLSPDEVGIELMGEVQRFGERPVSDLARAAGIERYVHLLPSRPRRAALEFLSGAGVLVCLPQDSHLAIPGKVFDYMRFDAWILALAEPESATARLLAGSGADVVSPRDPDAIAGVLAERYREFRAGIRPTRLGGNGRFSRREQARRLFDAVDAQLDERS